MNKRDQALQECRNDLSAYCMGNAHFLEAGGNVYMESDFDVTIAVAQRVDAIRKKLWTVTGQELEQILKIQNIRFIPTPQIQDFCSKIQAQLLEKIAA